MVVMFGPTPVYFENRILRRGSEAKIKARTQTLGANGNDGNPQFDFENRLEVWVFKVDAVYFRKRVALPSAPVTRIASSTN